MPPVHPSAKVLGSRNMPARYRICSPRLLFYLLSTTKYIFLANRTPSPPTAAAAQTLLFPSCTPSSSGAALPSPVNAFPPLRTSYLFPFFPCPMAPIPLAFIIQPSLLSALLGCQRKKGPRSFFFNLPSGLASAS